MRDLELSPRLRALADRVPAGARLADVGTDHAYLPAELVLSGKIPSALASDVREGPLDRGRETARLWGVEDQITFRCCDGLKGVAAEETDAVVIAGMGGMLIARILEAAPWTREKALLLQPMSTQPQLRRWLTEHGYVIQEETVVREENKYYVILMVTGGTSTPYTQAELWAGRQTQGQNIPCRLAYLDQLIRRRTRALAGMKRSSALPQSVMEEEQTTLTQLEQMREEWNAWQQ